MSTRESARETRTLPCGPAAGDGETHRGLSGSVSSGIKGTRAPAGASAEGPDVPVTRWKEPGGGRAAVRFHSHTAPREAGSTLGRGSAVARAGGAGRTLGAVEPCDSAAV